MTIMGERIRLRAIERGDIPTFVRWFNDPEVRQYLEVLMPMSQAQGEHWLEAYLDKGDSHIFGIETLDGSLIGSVGLSDMDWQNRRAVLSIVIGERKYWDNGYGTEAITTLLRFAFEEMNLHRVSLHVFDYNQRAMRCYEKCGFKQEGRLRQARFHSGKYHDELVMGILRDELGPDAE
jgi:RimJ/RimL family protein N-acetyltransferase